MRYCITLASLLLLSNSLHAAGNGGELFQQTCTRCHKSGPTAFRTSPEKIPALLRSGNIRQHRFKLSDEEIKHLATYLFQKT